MAYQIVTDSACNLTEEMIDEFGLEILPLTFMVDGVQHQSYLKGEKTDLKQFYTMMREGKVITTSLPNMQESEKTLRAIADSGKDILYLGFSSALSGTYAATELLLKQIASDYPDRTFISEETFAASGGQGMLVYLACKKAKDGASMEEVAQFVRDTRDHLCHWFTVDDLMFLFRGGRVSRTSAWAGTLLNIKPVLHVDNAGALIPMEKVRGRKKSIKALVDHMEKTAIDPKSQTIFITHGDCIEDVEALKAEITERFGITDFVVNYVDPVIGAHSGPGTLALFFVGTEK
ncbi:fatty acid-binding protein DegV [Slackia equolifaciens]|uniref:Fatty acid-binding protein DegV n=1 Tax=Slackia equolifaciens TaxID=498718 RepID=A0A3N0B1H7_9ACTN|nr:DegV family protein [Slackia equolifaciens]RNL40993.1 fatty acid-binding protein DegV [Slackia equolifaciens]